MNNRNQGYHIKGGRTGVLLLHGLNGTPSELRFVANGLARDGYTVYCPLLAGHGGEESDLKTSTWHDWYRSAEAALDELSAECETVVVGGLSTGAVLSLLLAANHPKKVHAISLYSPTLWLSGSQVPWYAPLFRLVKSKAFANLFSFPVPTHVGIKDQRIRDFIRNALAADPSAGPGSTPGGVVLERWRLAKVVLRTLGKIAQPALIIHARDDDYAGLDNAAFLQTKLAGPVDLTVLDDSYHMVTVDRQRHVVVARTTEFLSRVTGELKEGLGRSATVTVAARKAARPVALNPSAA